MELRPGRASLTFFLDKKSQQKNQDRFETRGNITL